MQSLRVAFLLSVAAGVALAQAPGPQPGEEHRKLMSLAGTWKGDGDLYATPLSAAGKLTLTNACTVYPGGYNLVCDLTGTFAGQPYRELQVLGYDQEARRYTWYDIDSTGINSLGYGSFENSTWTFVFNLKADGTPVQLKIMLTLLSATTAKAAAEVSVDGGPSVRMQDVNLQKVE
ncbi:MAG: DUF1579 family protein [Acidobacteriota bacterium]